MNGIVILLGVLLISIIMIGLKLKFYSYIFGEGGLLGPEDHSLSHEIKNLGKLRDRGLIDALRHAGRDDLPRYDYGYANSIARNNCTVGGHRCSLVPSGTFPSRSHLLCHRLFIDIKADLERWIRVL